MHQTFCNVPLQTLIKAANNDQLEGILFMKPDLIQKYLPPSLATSQGRMKRPRTGIRSTRKREKIRHGNKEIDIKKPTSAIHPNVIHTTDNKIPNDEPHKSNNIFCYAALDDKQTGILYTNFT